MILVFLQKIRIIGGFRSEGYFSDVSTRAIGLTGGPWEIGVILMFALSIIIYTDSRFFYKVLTIIVVFLLLLITGARLPTLSFFIVVGMYIYNSSKNKLALVISFFVIIPLFFLVLSQIDNPVIERSANLFSYSNIDQFIQYYQNININAPFKEFPDMPIDETSDMSWLFRVSKWSFAIKYWLKSTFGHVIGLGPGIWGFALDGGWIRVLTENGLIGITLYTLFLVKISKINHSLKMIAITLAINMIMIDIHMAYKCMAFLFFAVGYYCPKYQYKYLVKVNFN